MNAEFKRNLWAELSKQRLIAMPLVLGFFFFSAYTIGNSGPTELATAIGYALFILLAVWGGLLADKSFSQELRENTWDMQRMSPLSPWDLTVGKLFGKTIFVWYGAVFCVLAALFCKFKNPAAFEAYHLICIILIGFIAQALSLFFCILRESSHSRKKASQYSVTYFLSILCSIHIYYICRIPLPEGVTWYGIHYSAPVFFSMSLLLFIAGLLVGIYRLFKQELRIPTHPVGLPIFLIVALIYFYGLPTFSLNFPIHPPVDSDTQYPIFLWVYYGFVYAAILGAVFFARKNFVHQLRFFAATKHKKIIEQLRMVPNWAVSLPVMLCFLVGLLIQWQTLHLESPKEISFRVSSIGFCISLFGFLLRDIAVIYFIRWDLKAKRQNLSIFLYFILVYTLPAYVLALGFSASYIPSLQPLAWYFFEHISLSQMVMNNLLIYAQALLVVVGLYYRWHSNQIKLDVRF